MKRRNFSNEIKARVALESIKGLKSINEIAREYKVHPNLIGKWKKILLQGLPDVFDAKRGPQNEVNKDLIDELYRQIGKQQVELDWLKKKLNTTD